MASARRCLTFCVYLFSFLVFVISLMAPYWYKFKGMTLVGSEQQFSLSGRNPIYDIVHEKTVHGGIWLRCEKTLRTVCDITDFSEITTDRRVTFGAMIMALLLHLVSMGLFIRSLTKEWSLRTPAITLVVTVAFMILADIAFASSDFRSHLDWGFYLSIGSVVITLMCAIFMFILHSNDDDDYQADKIAIYDSVPNESMA